MKREYMTRASASNAESERERQNRAVAYRAACEGIVLLENDGTLPLDTGKLALYGAGAEFTTKGGTGSGEVNERRSVNIREGLESRGFTITSDAWLRELARQKTQSDERVLREQRAAIRHLKLISIMEMMGGSTPFPAGRRITPSDVRASDTDAAVYVLCRQGGEGADRKIAPGDYLVTQEERADIAFCAAAYPRFVLVINAGGLIDLSFLADIPGVNALLFMGQAGCEGGSALADILRGAVNPSGRLADTWAARYGDIPFSGEFSHLGADPLNAFYREGIYVGYRYFDSFHKAPRYPFGYGLSYTDFALRCEDVAQAGGVVTVRAAVTNTGARAGQQVAQLYLSAPEGALPREAQSLAAFDKTPLLAPGESAGLTLRFDLRDHAAYDEARAAFVLEPGDYLLRGGASSRDTAPWAVLTLDAPAVVSEHKNVCPRVESFDELAAPPRESEALPEGLPRLALRAADFATVRFLYETPPVRGDERGTALLRSLSLRDMAEIVTGVGMFHTKDRFTLPGSVGNTSSRFWDRGLVNVALCDGPAGLRVQQRSTRGKSGELRAVELPLSILETLPAFMTGFMRGDPAREPLFYQYTTAFPTATVLAQSWNRALAEEIGRAIHGEMAEYGCTFWLAPAVNIHRNPLCGRNFEYFSEDPFLTGAMAASLIRGVQCEPGYYATVKHFAANNQEEQRNKMSSHVSERALREIYLRAFERSVRESKVGAVMTSYNRLNGVYTPNSYDLCTNVLRCEWGFDGVVMTDWFATGNGRADHALALRAGNDMIMPGAPGCREALLWAVRRGRLTPEELRRACANVLRAILHSAIQRELLG